MDYTMKADGSSDLRLQGNQGIYGLYPGVDAAPVRPLMIIVEGSCARLRTLDGELKIQIESQEIRCSLQDYKRIPHTLSAFYEAEVRGLQGIYQVAYGMGDDTGYLPETELSKRETIESHGLIGLRFHDGVITLYGTDHAHYKNVYRVRRKGGRYYLSCDFYMENSGTERLPAVRIQSTGSMEEQLCAAAEDIGRRMQARRVMSPAYNWCSWYYCYHNFDMVQLQEYLEGFQNVEAAKDIRYFLVDAGYMPSVGDWLLPNERFPQGVKSAFDLIRSYGYEPGIWVGVFMVGNRSHLFQEHPDWVLHDRNGQIHKEWIKDNEPKLWGYQDEEYYVLDTSHPKALDYVRQVFRTLKQWGARLFKTDFMLWAMHDSTEVQRYTPGKTSVEYFRQVLQVIREEIGDDSYWLGCIAPFLPFVGYADGMRIGDDVGSSWNGAFGPQNMIRSLTGNVFANYSWYQIDPDAVMLRDFHIRLTDTEVESLALLAAMSGGCIYTSDPLHQMKKERQELFHFIKPDGRRRPSLPYLEEDRDDIVMVQKNQDGEGLVLLFNKTDAVIKEDYDISRLGFNESIRWTDFHTGEPAAIMQNRLYAAIPAHGCRLFKVSNNTTLNKTSLWKNL